MSVVINGQPPVRLVLTQTPGVGAPGVGLPAGGTTGQVLAKNSGTDYDTEWISASGVGDLLAANNLSELTATAATARTNIGAEAAGAAAAAQSAAIAAAATDATTKANAAQAAATAASDPAGTATSAVSSHAGTTSGVHGISTFGANLVDDADAAAARTTLGLGTAATTAATAYATAAQGTKADTAVQPARTISTTAPLTGGGDLSANRTLSVSAATDTAAGVVELATDAETVTGTDTTRATTPAGVAAAYVAKAAGGASVENIGAVESNVNTVATSGATETLDTSLYGVHDVTMDQACTFTFSNPAPSGKATIFTLILRGAFTPTWPASVDWPDATPPTHTTPALYVFTTVDAGTTWFGNQAGKAYG